METIIVICLLIVIVLMLHDRMVIHKGEKTIFERDKFTSEFPDIMGKSKPYQSHSVPNNASKFQNEQPEINPDNLDIEYDENENINIKNPHKEEPDEGFRDMPDFEIEEEEWRQYGIISDENGLAQGVTFEELSTVGMMLQKENLELSQKETTAAIVQKLQGTELFSLLENSIENASLKIAKLLDSTFSTETDVGSSNLRKGNVNDFNIREFI